MYLFILLGIIEVRHLNQEPSQAMIALLSVTLLQGLYQCVATNNVGTHNSFVSVVVIKRTKVSSLFDSEL